MRNNLVSHTGTVHLAVNTFAADRHACTPRRTLVPSLVEAYRTDDVVTCKSCLKVIYRAHELADRMMDAIDAGMTEAEEHHADDVKAFESGQRDRFVFSRSEKYSRAQIQRSRNGSVTYWFDRGDVKAVGNAAWAARRWELETEYLARLVAQAFDAATAEQRSNQRAEHDGENDPLVKLLEEKPKPFEPPTGDEVVAFVREFTSGW